MCTVSNPTLYSCSSVLNAYTSNFHPIGLANMLFVWRNRAVAIEVEKERGKRYFHALSVLGIFFLHWPCRPLWCLRCCRCNSEQQSPVPGFPTGAPPSFSHYTPPLGIRYPPTTTNRCNCTKALGTARSLVSYEHALQRDPRPRTGHKLSCLRVYFFGLYIESLVSVVDRRRIPPMTCGTLTTMTKAGARQRFSVTRPP